MALTSGDSEGRGPPVGLFATTQWSVVLEAGKQDLQKAAEALEKLCRTYWRPLYVYVRRNGYSPEDAQDLTQAFFTRLLDKNALADIRREGGKFRSYLLTAIKNFLINDRERLRAQKRDERKVAFSLDELEPELRYQVEPVDTATPETEFDRQWADTLLQNTMERLRGEYRRDGKTDLFQRLQPCLTGAEQMLPYAELAAPLGMSSDGVKMAVHRLRKRYGELLRTEVADTVASPRDAEDELRHLIAMRAQSG